jgi:hypothetical protein
MSNEHLPLLPHEEPVSPRADLWVAASFLAFGAAILFFSLRMPTYSEQEGQLYTAPGLVPGLYGVVIAILSLWLALRSIRRGALASSTDRSARETGNSNTRLAIAAGLGVLFTVGLIGRMPFWLAITIFVCLFITIFEWTPGLIVKARTRRVAVAVLQGLVTGAAVTLVFESFSWSASPERADLETGRGRLAPDRPCSRVFANSAPPSFTL